MALPASGQISMSQVRAELGLSGQFSMSAARGLFGVPSGSISMSQGHGKSAWTVIRPTTSTYTEYWAPYQVQNMYDGSSATSGMFGESMSDNHSTAFCTLLGFPSRVLTGRFLRIDVGAVDDGYGEGGGNLDYSLDGGASWTPIGFENTGFSRTTLAVRLPDGTNAAAVRVRFGSCYFYSWTVWDVKIDA